MLTAATVHYLEARLELIRSLHNDIAQRLGIDLNNNDAIEQLEIAEKEIARALGRYATIPMMENPHLVLEMSVERMRPRKLELVDVSSAH